MGTRQELFAGEFDGLLVASEYDLFEIVEMLSPYLAGSASIVVQNVFLQVSSPLPTQSYSFIFLVAFDRPTSKNAPNTTLSGAFRDRIMVTLLSGSPRPHPPNDEHIRVRRFPPPCH
jgi:hypothetical protein